MGFPLYLFLSEKGYREVEKPSEMDGFFVVMENGGGGDGRPTEVRNGGLTPFRSCGTTSPRGGSKGGTDCRGLRPRNDRWGRQGMMGEM